MKKTDNLLNKKTGRNTKNSTCSHINTFKVTKEKPLPPRKIFTNSQKTSRKSAPFGRVLDYKSIFNEVVSRMGYNLSKYEQMILLIHSFITANEFTLISNLTFFPNKTNNYKKSIFKYHFTKDSIKYKVNFTFEDCGKVIIMSDNITYRDKMFQKSMFDKINFNDIDNNLIEEVLNGDGSFDSFISGIHTIVDKDDRFDELFLSDSSESYFDGSDDEF